MKTVAKSLRKRLAVPEVKLENTKLAKVHNNRLNARVCLDQWKKYELNGVNGACRVLNLSLCFQSGQTFSWVQLSPGIWGNVLQDQLIVVSQDAEEKSEQAFFWMPQTSSPEQVSSTRALLAHYFRLDYDLNELYADWNSRNELLFPLDSASLRGIRLLRQPPFESLLSFICSQNNTISRITKMVMHLKEAYGKSSFEITSVCGDKNNDDDSMNNKIIRLVGFPEPKELGSVLTLTEELTLAGFGYRARYIHDVAVQVASGRLDLHQLLCPSVNVNGKGGGSVGGSGINGTMKEGLLIKPEASAATLPSSGETPQTTDELYQSAMAALLQLTGVGQKVADCVALTGLGYMQAVPIDTHIRKLADELQWNYDTHTVSLPIGNSKIKNNTKKRRKTEDVVTDSESSVKKKALTKSQYLSISSQFRALLGPHAGWAHLLLFARQLQLKKK